MKNLFKYSIACTLLFVAMSAYAQQKPIPEGFLPSAGSTAIGFSINPVAGIKANGIFKTGDFIGNSVAHQGSYPYQMFLLAQSPMASISVKHKFSDLLALKASVGFSGAYFNYREYVYDDVARFNNPLSEDVVEDNIRFSMAGGGALIGMEFTGGNRKLRFTGGLSLMYSFGGGSMLFKYGNTITAANQKPTCIQLISDSLNDYTSNGDVTYARPIKRYTSGVEHGIGIMCDLGIEWFFAERLSLGANVTFAPIVVAFQPQTYIIYEGYSKAQGATVEYNKLISPGSTTLLYGTENIGLVLSLHYYLK